MTTAPSVTIAVEGDLDQQVAVRLIEEAGGTIYLVHGKRGKPWLREQIGGYRNAAQYSRWVVLVDVDRDECPPELRNEWGVSAGAEALCFRVAVPSIESWLLADRENIASLPRHRARTHPAPSRLRGRREASAHQRCSTLTSRHDSRSDCAKTYCPRRTPLHQHTEPVRRRTLGPGPSCRRLARCRTRLAELVQRPTPA